MADNERIRVASLQYFIRPVRSFNDFKDQVEALVMTAVDYHCRLLVFPEYFSTQLLTLGDVKRPIQVQVRDLAMQRDRFLELFTDISRKAGMYIVAGTLPVLSQDGENINNVSYIFSPKGEHRFQGKMHMTRFEAEDWKVSATNELKVFETDFGRLGINICYDVEFPLLAQTLARQGASLLVVPSCTDDRQGFLRVRYCAQARAVENQMYVMHSSTVGSLPSVPAVSLNYGQASILTPSDFSFARDGILAEGIPNQETMVIAELNLVKIEEARSNGTVLNFRDGMRSAALAESVKVEVI